MPSTSDLADPKEYQKILHWAETQKDGTIPSFATRRNDPYEVCHYIMLLETEFIR
jgi:homogentisate 1,2-dioxygenase